MTDFLAIIPDANDADDLTGAVFAPLGTLPQTITGLPSGVNLRPHVLSMSVAGPVFQAQSAYTPAVITIDSITQDAAGGPVAVEHTINKDDATVRFAYRKSTSPKSLAAEFGSRNGPDYYDVPNVAALTAGASRSGTPVFVMAGQSNSTRMFGEGPLQAELTATGNPMTVIGSNAGGAQVAQPGDEWNVDAAIGAEYTNFLADWNAVLSATPDAYIAGMLWSQGEAEGYGTSDPWASAVTTLFQKMFTDIGYSFPIVISGLSSEHYALPANGIAHIQSEQQSVAAAMSEVTYLDTDALIAANSFTQAYVMDDGLHYTAAFNVDLAKEAVSMFTFGSSITVSGGPDGLLWDGQGGNPLAVLDVLPTSGGDADVASSPAFMLDSTAAVVGFGQLSNQEVINTSTPSGAPSALFTPDPSADLLVVMVTGNPSTALTDIGVTLNGVAFTDAVKALAWNNTTGGIFYMKASEIPSGQNSLVVTATGGTFDSCQAQVVQYSGTNQTTPIGATMSGNAWGSQTDVTLTMTEVDSIMLSMFGKALNATSLLPATVPDATLLYSGETTDTPAGQDHIFAGAESTPGATGAETHTFNLGVLEAQEMVRAAVEVLKA